VETDARPVSRLNFLGYKIDSINFLRNNNFKYRPVSIDFLIDSHVEYRAIPDRADVAIDLTIFRDAEKNDFPFSLNMKVVGAFSVSGFNKDTDTVFFEKNALAIMFPYLRALVTTITANANIQPLILPPINVVKYFEDREDAGKKKSAPSGE
jgi:preprotein translocase subunit SecB